MTSLSVVIVARDEGEMLPGCLGRLGFADEIVVVVDDRTTDRTEELARAAGAVVVRRTFDDFAGMKNAGLGLARSRWALVVDADERVPAPLADEIRRVVVGPDAAVRIGHDNVLLGHRMTSGDWTTYQQVRLFPLAGSRYEGAVHEVLVTPTGLPTQLLGGRLLHLTHRSMTENLAKTLRYAPAQASMRLAADPSPVTTRSFLRCFARELARRVVRHRGYRDGFVGWVEALHAAYTLAVVEVLAWEEQQDPGLDRVYRTLD